MDVGVDDATGPLASVSPAVDAANGVGLGRGVPNAGRPPLAFDSAVNGLSARGSDLSASHSGAQDRRGGGAMGGSVEGPLPLFRSAGSFPGPRGRSGSWFDMTSCFCTLYATTVAIFCPPSAG